MTVVPSQLLAQSRHAATVSGRSVVHEWLELHGDDPRQGARAMADWLGYRLLSTDELLTAQVAFQTIALSTGLQRHCIELLVEGTRCVAVSDPFDLALMNWLEDRLPEQVAITLALEGDIKARLEREEAHARAVELQVSPSSATGMHSEGQGEELSLVGIAEDASPVIRLVNSMLYDALKSQASDVHFESVPAGLNVKFRVDGVLDMITSVKGADMAEQAISRIKVLAELDIAERRVPQDGRFRVTVGGRNTDLRVSIMPSIHGEDAVLRILDKRQLVPDSGKLSLELLGFDTATLKVVRRLASEPYGMLLVTGPTGSGKTTTLYAAISETLTGKDKTVTIEDPVEYELSGVLQIPVNEKKGLTFARGLRSILRHDPDRILVGEIRDAETAEIAVQSALTGHLVLSSVHANSVFDVFSRFKHMGIDAQSLTLALNGVWAQRLVRTLCPRCGVRAEPCGDDVEALALDEQFLASAHLVSARGCGHCRGTGYRGRRAIAEVLVLTDLLRELIVNEAPISRVKEEARRGGTRLLRESALSLAHQGLTTLAEVRRVTLQG